MSGPCKLLSLRNLVPLRGRGSPLLHRATSLLLRMTGGAADFEYSPSPSEPRSSSLAHLSCRCPPTPHGEASCPAVVWLFGAGSAEHRNQLLGSVCRQLVALLVVDEAEVAPVPLA